MGGHPMNIYVDEIAKNSSNCLFMHNLSKHWDLEDYCFLNKMIISRINVDRDCPLVKLED